MAESNVFAVVTKSPGENLAYTIDFTDLLVGGEQITAATNSDPAPLTKAGTAGVPDIVSYDGGTNNALQIRLTEATGVFGDMVDVTFNVTTNAGTPNKYERIVRFVVALRSSVDRVRFLVGDTDLATQQVLDDAIVWALVEANEDFYGAAVIIARGLAAKYARRVSTAADGIRTEMQQLFDHYSELAKQLTDVAVNTGGVVGAAIGAPQLAGVSIAAMRSAAEDTDRVPSRVRIGMDDNPETGSSGEIS